MCQASLVDYIHQHQGSSQIALCKKTKTQAPKSFRNTRPDSIPEDLKGGVVVEGVFCRLYDQPTHSRYRVASDVRSLPTHQRSWLWQELPHGIGKTFPHTREVGSGRCCPIG